MGFLIQESGQSLRTRRQLSRTAGGGKKCIELKRNAKPSALGELIQEEAANSKCVPKKGTKEPKKRKGDSPPITQTRHDSPVSCEKKARLAQDSTTKGLATCRYVKHKLHCTAAFGSIKDHLYTFYFFLDFYNIFLIIIRYVFFLFDFYI